MTVHSRLPYRDDDGALAGLNAELDRAMATLAGLIAAGHRTVVLERMAGLLSGASVTAPPTTSARRSLDAPPAGAGSGQAEHGGDLTPTVEDRLQLTARLVAVRRARRLKHTRTLAPQLAAVAADLTAALTTIREDHR